MIDCNFRRRKLGKDYCLLKNNGVEKCDKDKCIFQRILNAASNNMCTCGNMKPLYLRGLLVSEKQVRDANNKRDTDKSDNG